MKILKVMLSEGAVMPKRATEQAAGYDLCSLIDVVIPPTKVIGRTAEVGRYQVDTGVIVELAPGYKGSVKPRSGLAFNQNVTCHPGTIDSDFRGTIKVLLYNYSHIPVTIKKGERIAQIMFSKVEYPELVEAESLTETKRGTGSLGHTGK